MANKITAARFARLLKTSGLTDRTLAGMLHCSHPTIANWRAAMRDIPDEIIDWLAEFATIAARAPDYRNFRPAAGRKSKDTI